MGIMAMGNSDEAVDELVAKISEEEKLRQMEDWKEELRMTENEIQTLTQVIAAKEEYVAKLKQNLGINAWTEMSEEMKTGLSSFQSTTMKIASDLQVAQEKTTKTVSEYFHSWSSKVGEAYRGSQFQFGKQTENKK